MPDIIIDTDLDTIRPPTPSGYMERPWDKEPYGSLPFAAAFPDEMLVPWNDMDALYDEMIETKSRLSDMCDFQGVKSLHQGRTSMCWTFNVAAAMQAIRARMNLPPIKLSPASAASPCMNFRDNGGWSTKSVRWIAEYGINTEEEWGNSQTANDRRLWTPEAKAAALTRRWTEWTDIQPRNWHQQLSMAFHRIPVSTGHSSIGHAICQYDPVRIERGSWKSGACGLRFRDSYGNNHDGRGMYVWRYPACVADDAIAPRVVMATEK